MAQDEHDLTDGKMAQDDGLAEAQIAAIESAFAEHGRMLARLRRELSELRALPVSEAPGPGHDRVVEERLAAIEARLDQQDQALRHVLQRLIAFFEAAGSAGD